MKNIIKKLAALTCSLAIIAGFTAAKPVFATNPGGSHLYFPVGVSSETLKRDLHALCIQDYYTRFGVRLDFTPLYQLKRLDFYLNSKILIDPYIDTETGYCEVVIFHFYAFLKKDGESPEEYVKRYNAINSGSLVHVASLCLKVDSLPMEYLNIINWRHFLMKHSCIANSDLCSIAAYLKKCGLIEYVPQF